jgi:glucose-6-phosphate-specific signal transduction histidine kinase
LAHDVACSSICWELIHESCANAIRHGKATWVSIRLLEPSERELSIDVVDNGSVFNVDAVVGMGTKILDACTLSWTRTRDSGQTSLRATLPVQANDR